MIEHYWYAEILKELRGRLSEKRFLHSVSTEKTAFKLAVRYGADCDKVRTAALFHDITKDTQLNEQLNLCEKYGIMVDNLEMKDVKLIHSKTAVAVAFNEFNITDADILDAVKYHTTGRKNMSLIEKIIFLADYIEPLRGEYDGVAELRLLAYEDIDKAMLFALELTVKEVEKKKKELHGATLTAYYFYKRI